MLHPTHLSRACLACLLMGLAAGFTRADEPVFSGPQVGERLPEFKVRGAFDDDAGKDLDFVARAAGKPLVLVFIHDATRPSISMTRILSAYALTRAKDGLASGVVWLDDDVSAAESALKRMRHALAPGAPTGISLDGREGPGNLGLNRNVMLTIVVAKENRVTANFALVQPSIQADLPKILQAIADVVGGAPPKLEELPGVAEMMRPRGAGEPDPELRNLLRPLIRKEASPSEVEAAGRKVEQYIAEHEPARQEIGRIASTIVSSGKLTDYGTEPAQRFLQKWAKAYGNPAGAEGPQRAKPGEPK